MYGIKNRISYQLYALGRPNGRVARGDRCNDELLRSQQYERIYCFVLRARYYVFAKFGFSRQY